MLFSRGLPSFHVVGRSPIRWLISGVEFRRTVVARLAAGVGSVPTLSLTLIGRRRCAVTFESVSIIEWIMSRCRPV